MIQELTNILKTFITETLSGSLEYDTPDGVQRVSDILHCPHFESQYDPRRERLVDGLLLDEALKKTVAQHIPEAQFDVELRRKLGDLEVVGHPDILIPHKAIIDIKHTQTLVWDYHTEEVVVQPEISERYQDQVRIYRWLYGEPVELYLMGRIILQFHGYNLHRFFVYQVKPEDIDMNEYMSRIPRYPWECQYCSKRDTCPYSKYTQKLTKYDIVQKAKQLGYERLKIYKGWSKVFKEKGGLVYSDGDFYEVRMLDEDTT